METPWFALQFVPYINWLMLYILFYNIFNLTCGTDLAMLAALNVLSALAFNHIATPQLYHSPANDYLFSVTNIAAMNIFVCASLETHNTHTHRETHMHNVVCEFKTVPDLTLKILYWFVYQPIVYGRSYFLTPVMSSVRLISTPQSDTKNNMHCLC